MESLHSKFSYNSQNHTFTVDGIAYSTKGGSLRWKKSYLILNPEEKKVSVISLNFFQRGARLLGAYKPTRLKSIQEALKRMNEPFTPKKGKNIASIREQLFTHLSKPQRSPSTPQEEFIDVPVSVYEEIATGDQKELHPYAMVQLAEMHKKSNDHEKAMEWYEKAYKLITGEFNPARRMGEVCYRLGCAYREAAEKTSSGEKAKDYQEKAEQALLRAIGHQCRPAHLEYGQILYQQYEKAEESDKANIKNEIVHFIEERMQLGYYEELLKDKKILHVLTDWPNFNIPDHLFALQEMWHESQDQEIQQIMEGLLKAPSEKDSPSIDTWKNLTPQNLKSDSYFKMHAPKKVFLGLIYERARQYSDAYKAYTECMMNPWAQFRSASLVFTGKVESDDAKKEEHRDQLLHILPHLTGKDLEQAIEWLNIDTSNLKHKEVAKRAAMTGSSKAMVAAEKLVQDSTNERDILVIQQAKMLFTGKYQENAYKNIKKQASWDAFDGSSPPNWFLEILSNTVPSALLKRLEKAKTENNKKFILQEAIADKSLLYASCCKETYQEIYAEAAKIHGVESTLLQSYQEQLILCGDISHMKMLGKSIYEKDKTNEENVQQAVSYLWAAGYILGQDEEAKRLLTSILEEKVVPQLSVEKLADLNTQRNYYRFLENGDTRFISLVLEQIDGKQENDKKNNESPIDESLIKEILTGNEKSLDEIIKMMAQKGGKTCGADAPLSKKFHVLYSAMKNEANGEESADNLKAVSIYFLMMALFHGHKPSSEEIAFFKEAMGL